MLSLAFQAAQMKSFKLAAALVALLVITLTFASASAQTATNAKSASVAAAEAEEDARKETLAVARARADTRGMLVASKFIAIHSRTAYLTAQTLESALRGRKDFQASGLVITDNETDADAVIEVNRAIFTTEYPFTVLDRRSRIVIASGKVNSLFGTAAGKISDSFMKQARLAKAAPTQKSKP